MSPHKLDPPLSTEERIARWTGYDPDPDNVAAIEPTGTPVAWERRTPLDLDPTADPDRRDQGRARWQAVDRLDRAVWLAITSAEGPSLLREQRSMSANGVQLPFDGLPLDPDELAKLTAPDRGEVYRRLGLDHPQVEAAEAGVRQVIARQYRRPARRSAR